MILVVGGFNRLPLHEPELYWTFVVCMGGNRSTKGVWATIVACGISENIDAPTINGKTAVTG